MAKEPLFFHVREKNGSATFAVQAFNDSNFSIGYAVTHKGDAFCKRTGRKIAQERSTYILQNAVNNAKRGVHTKTDYLPHIIRRNIEKVVKRSAELLRSQKNTIFGVTWADSTARGDLVQIQVEVEDPTKVSNEVMHTEI